MKPGCLLSSVIPPILSTGAMYNRPMVIVTNKLPPSSPGFLLHLPSRRRAWQTPWISARECRRRRVMKKHRGTGGMSGVLISCLIKYAVVNTSSGGLRVWDFHPLHPGNLCSGPVLSCVSHTSVTKLSSVPLRCLVASLILIKHSHGAGGKTHSLFLQIVQPQTNHPQDF